MCKSLGRVKATAAVDHALCLVLGSGCVDLGPYQAYVARRMSAVPKSVWEHLLRHGPLWLVERLERAPMTSLPRAPTWEDFIIAQELHVQDFLAFQDAEGSALYAIVAALCT